MIELWKILKYTFSFIYLKDLVGEVPIKSVKKHRSKKKHLAKKSYFNPHGNFYPGSLWEYPYPYYHPQYAAVLSAVMSPCACKQG